VLCDGLKEAYVDPTRDESLIFEFLEFKHDVGDDGSAVWFLQDLANEQEAEGDVVNLILTFISLFWFYLGTDL
jgi:ferritin